MDAPASEITADGMDRVLAFLAAFENPGVPLYQVVKEPLTFEPYRYGKLVADFIRALYDTGLIAEMDWASWQHRGMLYLENRTRIETSQLPTIQKLFTAIVRKDRFCAGTLAAAIDDGLIVMLLRRLKTIRDRLVARQVTEGQRR